MSHIRTRSGRPEAPIGPEQGRGFPYVEGPMGPEQGRGFPYIAGN
jgi:hypothetical protein